ncbi:hypothetical protein [Dictyobacter aurantiacus]|uniref:Uncharacterized protein n=1 Tax=Dictyobacter aurantiacus TaxID=1936993 RepID=A0A401ZMC4_9CHLR|nr:hypothetical protein [Dictyobacter aurantiacus]GCE08027.1 hypothetical protein KDAU_53560 [Dictyobacter aurantiacus]
MGIFQASREQKSSIEENNFIPQHINFADDIKEIRRARGNIDIRNLHPEMTEQETAEYLRTLIANHMSGF